MNPGQERPGTRTHLKNDGSCLSFSGVNPGRVHVLREALVGTELRGHRVDMQPQSLHVASSTK